MKYYTTTTEFNCGIDLHARQMYVCVMDRPHRCTAVSFWTARRRWIVALEGGLGFLDYPPRELGPARLSPNRCLAGTPFAQAKFVPSCEEK